MEPAPPDSVASRLRAAFELYDLGLSIKRQSLCRQFASESAAAIDRRLLEWRMRRDDAPDGDGEGRLVPFPRLQR
jgi:hypothetical protein